MNRKTIIAIYTIFATGAGVLWQIWLSYSTPVAFKVRPELLTLTFWEAFVSGHFNEWLYRFHFPVITLLNLICMPLVGFLVSWWLTTDS